MKYTGFFISRTKHECTYIARLFCIGVFLQELIFFFLLMKSLVIVPERVVAFFSLKTILL